MHVPVPVVEVALILKSGRPERLSRALSRFVREDPSLSSFTDPDSGELRLRGMGELHLEVYAERLRADYGCEVELGRPEVALRQTLPHRIDIHHTHKKQNGGPGQYTRIIGYIDPCDQVFDFRWEVVRGEIPTRYKEPIRRSFLAALSEDLSLPLVGVRVVITGGDTHVKDSSELVFSIAVREPFREAVEENKPVILEPVILEPIMRVDAEVESVRSGAMLRTMLSRRGRVLSSEVCGDIARASADIPLVELFGYANALQSATAGSGSFTMRFDPFEPRC